MSLYHPYRLQINTGAQYIGGTEDLECLSPGAFRLYSVDDSFTELREFSYSQKALAEMQEKMRKEFFRIDHASKDRVVHLKSPNIRQMELSVRATYRNIRVRTSLKRLHDRYHEFNATFTLTLAYHTTHLHVYPSREAEVPTTYISGAIQIDKIAEFLASSICKEMVATPRNGGKIIREIIGSRPHYEKLPYLQKNLHVLLTYGIIQAAQLPSQ